MINKKVSKITLTYTQSYCYSHSLSASYLGYFPKRIIYKKVYNLSTILKDAEISSIYNLSHILNQIIKKKVSKVSPRRCSKVLLFQYLGYISHLQDEAQQSGQEVGHFVPADGAGGGGGPRQLRLPILAPLSTLSPEEQHEAHFPVVENGCAFISLC